MYRPFALIVFCYVTFLSFSIHAISIPMVSAKKNLLVSFPPLLELVLSFGDRYISANLNLFRMQVTDLYNSENIDNRVYIHDSISILNPRSEDNYYVASATLPWEGHNDTARSVLLRASESRPFDAWPYFYAGLNEKQFTENIDLAAEYMFKASERESGSNKEFYKALAAKFYTQLDDVEFALAHIELIKKDASPELINFLNLRKKRLLIIKALRKDFALFQKKYGRVASLKELVIKGYLSEVPVDPLGIGFRVDDNGRVY